MFTWQEKIGLFFLFIVLPIGVIGFLIYLLTGGLQSFALRPLQRRFEGIDLHDELKPGDVFFVYHTYHGLLLWTTMNEHRVIAPPADAQKLLRRLLWFNLSWGMLGYGMIFIPLLAIGNYYSGHWQLLRTNALNPRSTGCLHARESLARKAARLSCSRRSR